MQFATVEAEIEFFASLVKADGWLEGDVSLIDYAFVLMYIDYEIDKKNKLQHIDLDQPTAVLSQLNVWLNDKGKAVEQGVQLRKRKRIIPMWKIIEGSELVPKTLAQTTGLQMLGPMKAIPHDDLVNLLKLCWEWRQDPK